MEDIIEKIYRTIRIGETTNELKSKLSEWFIDYEDCEDIIETERLDYKYNTECKCVFFNIENDKVTEIEEVF